MVSAISAALRRHDNEKENVPLFYLEIIGKKFREGYSLAYIVLYSNLVASLKIFERLIFKHLIMFFELVFSKYQCGFRKGHSAQHCLVTMTEKWKKCLDSNDVCGTLLTDLPKTFDFLPHSLLIAKLHVYGFDKTSTEYLKDYLSHRKQKIKINKTFSK